MSDSKTILIVEDEEKVASFIKKGLFTQGYISVIATTGREALGFFETQNNLVSMVVCINFKHKIAKINQ